MAAHRGEEWKRQAVQNLKEMIVQYRNHPSIILWGVRINESQDDDVFTGKQTGWHMNWTIHVQPAECGC